MTAVGRGIDETSNTVQLNGFFGKTFYFYNVSFSKCNFTCAFICFFICQCACFSSLFSTLNISQGFSLNFPRTLKDAYLTSCRNGSRVTSPAVYIWKVKLEFVSKQHGFPTKPKE